MGPGLLYAGAAIGVSHLVQSTRAGAGFGFELIWAIILANVMKYPFFQFAPRYTAATGNNLIEGYKKLGNWAVILYLILTVLSMFAIQAAVTIVTAGLLGNIFHIQMTPAIISTILLMVTMLTLYYGRYSLLDKIIKWVIILLAISTIVAVTASAMHGYHPNPEYAVNFDISYFPHLAFLIALFGWMPAPLDISIWQSIWAEAKAKEQGIKVNKRQALLDFNIGYIGTAILAIGFLSLGALVMYGSGEELSSSGTVFAGQLISMYTKGLGSWSYMVIATAALMTMISTTITCFDAYARVMVPATKLSLPKLFKNSKLSDKGFYNIWMLVVFTGTILLLSVFAKNMQTMVDFATILSFIVAPLFGILNLKVITDKHVPEKDRPKMWMRIYAVLGIIFLTGFSIYYIYFRISNFGQ
jgi:Mn2+/Fe2+ NRAMP family transporter